jgi:hypothetical protein
MWWAHPGFTRINIELTILTNEIEENPDLLDVARVSGVFDRRANPSSVRLSPDVADTLRKSQCVSGVVGAVVGALHPSTAFIARTSSR